MALGDRYLEWRKGGPRGRRTLTLALAVLVHATAVVVALGWSLSHREGRPVPTLIVQPLIPQEGGGGPKIEKFKKQPAHHAPKRALTQPSQAVPEPPVDETPSVGTSTGSDDSGGGGPGDGSGPGEGPGIGGGPGGDHPGGDGPHPLLPPTVAETQKIAGEKPPYPQAARLAGIHGLVVAKICVDTNGTVAGVSIVRGLPMLNESVAETVRTWRYRPFLFNGRAMPFCHVANFVFNLQ